MLELQRFLIQEHVALLKTVDTYDILNPDTGQQVGVAREEPGRFIKYLRWLIPKQHMPTKVEVRETDDGEPLLFTIVRPVTFWHSRVEVYDAEEQMIGHFKSKVWSLGTGFWVHDQLDQPFAEVKGDWTAWNFQFLAPDGRELGAVTKQWAGLGKELLTSADNYLVHIHEDLSNEPIAKMLLLGTALAIDLIFKEPH